MKASLSKEVSLLADLRALRADQERLIQSVKELLDVVQQIPGHNDLYEFKNAFLTIAHVEGRE